MDSPSFVLDVEGAATAVVQVSGLILTPQERKTRPRGNQDAQWVAWLKKGGNWTCVARI